MSEYEEFCGCGEYSCKECFPDLAAKGMKGNAWLDDAWWDVLEQQRAERDRQRTTEDG